MANHEEHDKWDKEKIALEREKLAIERFKAQWTGISIFVPLAVIAMTIGFNVWSQNQQAKSDFAIKAAEIVLNAETPGAASAKAKALQDLFPDRLPSNFYESFHAESYSGPNIRSQKELLHLIVQHGDRKREIIDMWRKLFPEDRWVDDLK